MKCPICQKEKESETAFYCRRCGKQGMQFRFFQSTKDRIAADAPRGAFRERKESWNK